MNNNDKLVEVFKASNELEAHIIQDVLESHNIPSILMPSISLPSAYAPMQIHGTVQVMVMESLADSARKLIKSDDNV